MSSVYLAAAFVPCTFTITTSFVLSPQLWTDFQRRHSPIIPTIPTTTPSTTIITESNSQSLTCHPILPNYRRCSASGTIVAVYAPPGSGYFSPEDEVSSLPDTYEPMWEYPGTMRPGRTPENIPYQDLPIADSDPDPVPWPHFQQIDWHHRWDPPHPHPIPVEDFIELNGRWATPELEATMRAGARRGVRERREAEEAARKGNVITDDDEDDDIDDDDMEIDPDEAVSLGDGIFGKLGSAADQAATAAAVDPKNQNRGARTDGSIYDDDDGGENGDDDASFDASLDDILFDLGLDSELDDDNDEDETDNSFSNDDDGKTTATITQAKSWRELESDDDEDDKVDEGVKAIQVDDDDDLGFDEDDEDDGSGSVDGGVVPLDDFGDSENSDLSDNNDIFDEGGFDFEEDGGDFGDMEW